MFVTLTVARYSGKYILMGIFSMVFFRISLFIKSYNAKFIKLMGTGKNGTFDIHPDFGQWTYLMVWNSESDYNFFFNNSLIYKYINLFSKKNFTLFLHPKQVHGQWDGKQPFGANEKEIFGENETIVVLTRATIKPLKAIDFWKNVPHAAKNLSQNIGYLYSIGVGEVPFFKQATVSIWKNEESMKAFAYKQAQHNDVIKKTRTNKWYSEELFARFRIAGHSGKLPESLENRL